MWESDSEVVFQITAYREEHSASLITIRDPSAFRTE
ncbi:uncharacterized, partial [Tachysurus ichikawai]